MICIIICVIQGWIFLPGEEAGLSEISPPLFSGSGQAIPPFFPYLLLDLISIFRSFAIPKPLTTFFSWVVGGWQQSEGYQSLFLDSMWLRRRNRFIVLSCTAAFSVVPNGQYNRHRCNVLGLSCRAECNFFIQFVGQLRLLSKEEKCFSCSQDGLGNWAPRFVIGHKRHAFLFFLFLIIFKLINTMFLFFFTVFLNTWTISVVKQEPVFDLSWSPVYCFLQKHCICEGGHSYNLFGKFLFSF